MKLDRQLIIEKYDYHCAYCGCEITLKTMQVDHKTSIHIGGTNDIENLMPACRLCNHYKRAETLETFRGYIVDMLRKLEKVYIFRVSEKYGMINWKKWDGLFYFERTP